MMRVVNTPVDKTPGSNLCLAHRRIQQHEDANPIPGPGEGLFPCPFLDQVNWKDRNIRAPTAVGRDKKLTLLDLSG